MEVIGARPSGSKDKEIREKPSPLIKVRRVCRLDMSEGFRIG